MINDKFAAASVTWAGAHTALAWLLASGVAAQAADLVAPLAATASTTLSQGRSAITAHRLQSAQRFRVNAAGSRADGMDGR